MHDHHALCSCDIAEDDIKAKFTVVNIVNAVPEVWAKTKVTDVPISPNDNPDQYIVAGIMLLIIII